MEAIIWMDVIQGFLLIIGGIMAIVILFHLTEGGASAILNIAAEHHKIDFGPYAWDFTQLTFIVMVFNGIFYAIQNMVQTKVLYSDILPQELIKAQKSVISGNYAKCTDMGFIYVRWHMFICILSDKCRRFTVRY